MVPARDSREAVPVRPVAPVSADTPETVEASSVLVPAADGVDEDLSEGGSLSKFDFG
jgi:hypothetical protein